MNKASPFSALNRVMERQHFRPLMMGMHIEIVALIVQRLAQTMNFAPRPRAGSRLVIS